MTNIPKIIHFFHDADIEIWEKNKSPQLRMCYMSWKRFCPDYEIMHWHVNMPEFQQMLKDSKFLREVYKRKMWASVSDYIRYYALYTYGGVYLDTDVELIKNFDEYLNNDFFCSIEGTIINNEDIPEPAVIAGVKGHQAFKDVLKIYNSDAIFQIESLMAPVVLKKYLKDKINFSKINYNSEITQEKINKTYELMDGKTIDDYEMYKNQEIFHNEPNKITLYPAQYFCPRWNTLGEKSITSNTAAIHWNQSSWWGSKKDDQNMNHLKSLKYHSKLKRFIYLNIKNIVKIQTLLIFNKTKRKTQKDKLTKQIMKFLSK